MNMKKILCAGAAIGAGLLSSQALAQRDQCFIGEVRMFGGNFAPRGWALAEGQLLAISQNDALFAILGTTYGGDGRTTFGLPDLRGRLPIGPRQGPGLSDVRLGEKGGSERITLNSSTMPGHTHAASTTSALHATTTGGNSPDPEGRLLADDGADRIYLEAAADVDMAADAATSTTSLGATGGSQSINNTQPAAATNYIVCLFGIFPSRN